MNKNGINMIITDLYFANAIPCLPYIIFVADDTHVNFARVTEGKILPDSEYKKYGTTKERALEAGKPYQTFSFEPQEWNKPIGSPQINGFFFLAETYWNEVHKEIGCVPLTEKRREELGQFSIIKEIEKPRQIIREFTSNKQIRVYSELPNCKIVYDERGGSAVIELLQK